MRETEVFVVGSDANAIRGAVRQKAGRTVEVAAIAVTRERLPFVMIAYVICPVAVLIFVDVARAVVADYKGETFRFWVCR